jgi:hypothetical protein
MSHESRDTDLDPQQTGSRPSSPGSEGESGRPISPHPATEPPLRKNKFSEIYDYLLVAYSVGYIVSILTLVVGLILGVMGAATEGDGAVLLGCGLGMLFIAVGSLFWLISYGIWLYVMYKGWESVQCLRELDASDTDIPTPGKAIGFTFIPFYNFYWFFVCIPGLAKRMKKLAELKGWSISPVSHDVSIFFCIASICTVVPGFNYLAYPAVFISQIILFFQMAKAVDQISKNQSK